ncbi:hypothetical protein EII29_06145 [Leptotrichia sp. OH3620_COT-345]|uniref:hypothetical protein n=1 Tax=Leptotrichia sp. OH3620_COT-345 TaxID=2491048 RepID=UPI000F64B03A|nr:hypothetical protein [Leptotrichia sp. OH3620_COT-345]RRD39616.1 hypothetical protein EII29_06145 [Leptotrichia sp. OH3620_COT-345]
MRNVELSKLNNKNYEKIYNNETIAYKFLTKKAETYTKFLYKKEKLSDEIYKDNIKDITIWSDKYKREKGNIGLYEENAKWINSILEMKVIKLGRLQFEICEHIDEKLRLIIGNIKDFLFVNVHIREGEKLLPDLCEISYKRALEYYKSKGLTFSGTVFICHSWLLNPDLKTLLPENSNIIQFQKRYTFLFFDEKGKIPQILQRVYGQTEKEIKMWQQNTVLQVNLKKAWQSGQRFPMTKGYFIIPSL